MRSVDTGQANLAIIPAGEAGLRVQVVTGQEGPEFQGWVGIKDHQQGEYEPTPTALYAGVMQGPTRLVTLLYPTPAGQACPVTAVSAATGTADTAIRLKMADGSEQTLDEASFSF